MRRAALLAGAAITAATSALADPVPSISRTYPLATSPHGSQPVSIQGFNTPDGNYVPWGIWSYKGEFDAAVNVTSIPDPTQLLHLVPSLAVSIDGKEHFVEFNFDSSMDSYYWKTPTLGRNEFHIPFDRFDQVYPLDPSASVLTAVASANVVLSFCCTTDSIAAYAQGDVTVIYTDPPTGSVPEPSSGLLLLAGVLGFSGMKLRRSIV